jgi:SAM-dependent methyltransferase
MTEKAYDRAYYDRWYRSRRRVVTPASIARKARLALAAAEFYLERPVRSVLDVGCGEGQWRAVLRRMRPGLRWLGVDPSDYVVGRYGRRRNIRRGGFGDLPDLRLGGPFDLVVCADALQYVTTPDLRRGLATIVERLNGVAWLEAHTVDDDLDGDRKGWQRRTAAQYRRILGDAGLAGVGMHCWVPREWVEGKWVGRLERPD